ncbi:hypothetical protein [Streptomyces pseudovenezuelae]|uniref:hypothetical protein n=1 Tax=Streptomyces pseudovenezuelae TaxID=67350 RepID=UPI0036E8F5E1
MAELPDSGEVFVRGPLGGRWPRCACGSRISALVAPRPLEGPLGTWLVRCELGRSHPLPAMPYSADAWPACPACGGRVEGLRLVDDDPAGPYRVGLVDCGHQLVIPWPVALGLV